VDNVDQLSPAYQAQIFLLSQRVTRIVNSITVVSLREESYYTASVQKAFTAYTNRKFHIASPRFLSLISNRINYALSVLNSPAQLESIVSNQISINRSDIVDYLKIISDSIFQQNRTIVKFIEAICFGNMRLALNMFTTFLASGATDVDKMLRIYRKTGAYHVAFHEFVKSIMLGERRYYKEIFSPIMNVFDCGLERNSSHFTSLRILHLLLGRRNESTPEGEGYVEISQASAIFEDFFDNREDFIRSINRLVARQLVEVNTRSTENIQGASHARATSAGWYYATRLSKSFPYLDLILQDCPFSDHQVATDLRDSVRHVDNLYDREEDKMNRIRARFDRVEKLLNYFEAEEKAEFVRLQLNKVVSPVTLQIVPEMRKEYLVQKEWIRNRLAENRERFAEEILIDLTELETGFWAGEAGDPPLPTPSDALGNTGPSTHEEPLHGFAAPPESPKP
jgi:hypothetical protein